MTKEPLLSATGLTRSPSCEHIYRSPYINAIWFRYFKPNVCIKFSLGIGIFFTKIFIKAYSTDWNAIWILGKAEQAQVVDSTNKLKFGIIGTGWIAESHVESLKTMPDVADVYNCQ